MPKSWYNKSTTADDFTTKKLSKVTNNLNWALSLSLPAKSVLLFSIYPSNFLSLFLSFSLPDPPPPPPLQTHTSPFPPFFLSVCPSFINRSIHLYLENVLMWSKIFVRFLFLSLCMYFSPFPRLTLIIYQTSNQINQILNLE